MSTTVASTSPVTAPRVGRWWSIHVVGDLDVASGPDLEARLRRADDVHPGAGFVLDLACVDFMDCSGLRPVLRARDRLPGRLCLRGPGVNVRRLLDLTAVTPTLRILPGDTRWPPEADPLDCHVLLDDRRGPGAPPHLARADHDGGQVGPPVPDPR